MINLETILARCTEDGDCLLWQGAVDSDGVPVISVRRDGKRLNLRARPLLFDLLGKHRRKGRPYTVATCWSPRCLAPEHLLDVNRREQAALASAAGRYKNPARDAKQRRIQRASGQAKLTMAKAREIRARYVPRQVSMPQLAREYGVHTSLIYRVIHGLAWAEHASNASIFHLARSA